MQKTWGWIRLNLRVWNSNLSLLEVVSSSFVSQDAHWPPATAVPRHEDMGNRVPSRDVTIAPQACYMLTTVLVLFTSNFHSVSSKVATLALVHRTQKCQFCKLIHCLFRFQFHFIPVWLSFNKIILLGNNRDYYVHMWISCDMFRLVVCSHIFPAS